MARHVVDAGHYDRVDGRRTSYRISYRISFYCHAHGIGLAYGP